ncbi:MAG: diguanylate cyclase [Desulfobacca sp. 4484_104]|nr:MAG: diguanylate cyclase [Desulfobacca sp. 4484_104]RLA88762.1 MAG: diguanylate cyclase [Deltaproteobacteria bacterium]
MFAYLIKRLLLMIPLLLGITLVSFVVIHLAPGSPTEVQTMLQPKASLEAQQRLRELYGLDRPLHVQYWDWLQRLARLDLGRSFSPDARPVWDKIKERIGVTISINLLSMLLILVIAIPIGVIAATYPHSWFDQATTLFVFLGFAMPGFWLALLLMMLFGVYLDWLPLAGLTSHFYERFTTWQKIQDLAYHLTLPVLVSAFGGLAGMSRYMRGNMLEVIRQDYITTARAKGLPERTVIFKHALKNALMPVITILGLSVPGLIGGSVIFESIFAIPGMGQLFYQAVMARDYPLVMGELVIGALLTLLGNLLADVSYALADPRLRTG